MKKIVLSLVATAVISTGVMAEGFDVKDVEVSANVAMTSNYVWRGMTQSANSSTVQGGFDLGYNNFYAGTWGSNVDFGNFDDGTRNNASMEMDFYAGYADTFYDVDYDLGYIQYAYPNEAKADNFGEAYVSLSKTIDMVTLEVNYAYGVKTDTTDPENNLEGTISLALPMDLGVDLTYGDYNNIGKYYSVGVTKSYDKFDLNVAFTGMDYKDDATDSENNLVATVSTSF